MLLLLLLLLLLLQVDTTLQHSMEQLQYLGSLLGLPSISDPHFPLAYATFFGSLPVTTDTDMEITTDRSNVLLITYSTIPPLSLPLSLSLHYPFSLLFSLLARSHSDLTSIRYCYCYYYY